MTTLDLMLQFRLKTKIVNGKFWLAQTFPLPTAICFNGCRTLWLEYASIQNGTSTIASIRSLLALKDDPLFRDGINSFYDLKFKQNKQTEYKQTVQSIFEKYFNYLNQSASV